MNQTRRALVICKLQVMDGFLLHFHLGINIGEGNRGHVMFGSLFLEVAKFQVLHTPSATPGICTLNCIGPDLIALQAEGPFEFQCRLLPHALQSVDF